MIKLTLEKIMRKNPQIWTVNSILYEGYGKVLLHDNQRACLNLTNFYFIEGPFLESFAEELFPLVKVPTIITSSNNDWYDYWIKKTKGSLERVTRRMYIWEDNVEMLTPYLHKKLKSNYFLKKIGKEEIQQMQNLTWTEENTYGSIDNFLKLGFGYCILDSSKIISVCISYAHSKYGVEIEVDTDPEYQQQGLAKIVASHFTLDARNRGLLPLWDATNKASEKIAETLGFKFIKQYESLWYFP